MQTGLWIGYSTGFPFFSVHGWILHQLSSVADAVRHHARANSFFPLCLVCFFYGMGMPLEGEHITLLTANTSAQAVCVGAVPLSALHEILYLCQLTPRMVFNLAGWSGGWFWIMELATLTWRKEWKMLLFLPAMCLWSMRKREYTANARVLRTFI